MFYDYFMNERTFVIRRVSVNERTFVIRRVSVGTHRVL